VELLDALSAKDCQVVGTIKMLHPFLVVVTQLIVKSVFILFVKIEIRLRKDWILLDYFIKDVDI
jgi:hypothetical protein